MAARVDRTEERTICSRHIKRETVNTNRFKNEVDSGNPKLNFVAFAVSKLFADTAASSTWLIIRTFSELEFKTTAALPETVAFLSEGVQMRVGVSVHTWAKSAVRACFAMDGCIKSVRVESWADRRVKLERRT
jgi:hypothetical protein